MIERFSRKPKTPKERAQDLIGPRKLTSSEKRMQQLYHERFGVRVVPRIIGISYPHGPREVDDKPGRVDESTD